VRILACIKRVPAPGARINITADGKAVDTAFLGFTMSPHEECALEAALQLSESHAGATTVLTLGPREAEEQLRYAASLGIERAVLLPITEIDWDAQRTAGAIVDAIRGIESEHGVFDLVLFGNESADSCGFQVGVRVSVALGRPMVNGAKSLEVAGEVARIQRESDAGQEVYELPLPAVVGVKEGINLPRYPTMKGRLASKKVTIAEHVTDVARGGLATATLAPPPADVHASLTTILGNGAGAAPAVVDLLEQLGVA